MNDNSFYSIDRLVEFGLGMAMARQMINVMNETMQTMYVPGSAHNVTIQQATCIYVAINGQSVGPLNEKDFSLLVADGKVNKDSLVWMPGMLAWKPLQEVPSALKIIALAPPPLPTV